MQTNLRIKSTSSFDGKSTVTDTISYVNPNLSDANAKLLAQRINALTKNSYKETDRIDTRNLDSVVILPRSISFKVNYQDYDGTLARVPLSAVTSTNSGRTFVINTSIISNDSVAWASYMPIFDNFIGPEGVDLYCWQLETHQQSATSPSSKFQWTINIGMSVKQAMTISYDITIPAAGSYDSFNQHINIEIYDDGGEG